MTQPDPQPSESPPAPVSDGQDQDEATEEALAAAFAPAIIAWLALASAAVLAGGGVPTLSLMPTSASFVADAVVRAGAALRDLWGGTPLESYIPDYLRGLPYRLQGLARLAWKKSSQALADAQAAQADVEEMRRAVRESLSPAEYDAYADMLARTEASIAVNGARQAVAQRAANAGATVTKTWRTRRDSRVRETHREAEGQTRGVNEAFLVGGWPMMHPGAESAPASEVVNCFPAWTRVATPGLRAATRRWYEGDLVELRLASGGTLSATPNHPILNAWGLFVAAGSLTTDDHLIRVDTGDGGRTFADLYAATTRTFVPHQAAGQAADFHGDGTDAPTAVVHVDPIGTTASPTGLRRFAIAIARQARTGARPVVSTVSADTDRITEVTRRPFTGYVYNLDSGGGWYTADGLVAANCRCIATYDIQGGPR